jgi:hypothetical protein
MAHYETNRQVIHLSKAKRCSDQADHLLEPVTRLDFRLAVEFPLQSPDRVWCLQAHRQSPHLVRFKNIPEVRALPSAGITRFQRYYDPVRRPPGPMLLRTVEAATLIPRTGLPRLRNPCLDVLYPLPRWTGPGAFVGCFPSPCCLPHSLGGSASTTSLSRPAQALLTLRPVESLNRQKRPPASAGACFVAGLRYSQLPNRTACQLPGQPTIARVGLAPTR